MDSLLKAMYFIIAALSVWTIFMMVFQLVVTLKGFKKGTKGYEDKDPKNKFLIFVPAHNEEKVIAGIVSSLQDMDYPKDLYDFYILADNCTDNTAQIARDLGANVFEFFKDSPDSPTGKPIALQKAFAAISDYHKKYDLVMFFDADNVVESKLLREVNSQMICNPEAIATQCYLGTKNKLGLVPSYYYISYTISNRFFQLAKNRFNLNIAIGGTGFAVRTDYVHKRGGWKAMSLTEDFEFQIETTIDGKKILWNNEARVYDEKPTSIKACYKQQKRWAQGHWYVTFTNTKNLIKSFISKKISAFEFLSTSFYMYSLIPYFLITLQVPILLITGIIKYANLSTRSALDFSSLFSINLLSVFIFLYLYIVLFYVADYIDNDVKVDLKYIPTMIVSLFVNSSVITVAKVAGLFQWRQQSNWVKTEHSINSSIHIDNADKGSSNKKFKKLMSAKSSSRI